MRWRLPKTYEEKGKREAERHLRRGDTAMPVKVTPRKEGDFPNRSRQVERQNHRRANTLSRKR